LLYIRRGELPARPYNLLGSYYLKRLPRPHVLAFLFYLGVAIFITWPLATVFSTRLIGHPFSDSYEYIHHIWWTQYALQTGQSPFFQPLLAYPDGLPGAMVWSEPLQSFPAWLFAFVMPLPAAYNLQTLLTLALNGWAMYWLMGKLTCGLHLCISTCCSASEKRLIGAG
jgi:hypothetical protein